MALILFFIISAPLFGAQFTCEKTNYKETGSYQECDGFCKQIDSEFEHVEYRAFGVSAEGRDLPLLLINYDKEHSKPILLIVSCIHAGEVDGKDASLLLIRDVLKDKKHKGLFDNVTVAFVPIFSTDGHERTSPYNRPNQIGPKEQGFRTTAQNLNLNRDWMKADSPEMKAMLKLIHELNPDFLMDIHTTDGWDYQYVITYLLNMHENNFEGQRKFEKELLLPQITTKLEKKELDFVSYVETRGAYGPGMKWDVNIDSPRFSTGYASIIQRPCLILEAHSLKPFKQRVGAIYQTLIATIETVKKYSSELMQANREADEWASKLKGRYYGLSWGNSSDSTIVDFKGLEYKKRFNPVLKDSITTWSNKPKHFPVAFFDKHYVKDSTVVPYAYIIPSQWLEKFQAVFDAHGIFVYQTKIPLTVPAESYKLRNVKYSAMPNEGRFMVSKFDKEIRHHEKEYPAGVGVVFTDSPYTQKIVHLLEPDAPDSFLKWGFLMQIFEEKEYIGNYVMDTLAVNMLARDSVLNNEFNARIKSDSVFAGSASRRFQFFYERSPYYDNRKDVYPVDRVTTREGWVILHRELIGE